MRRKLREKEIENNQDHEAPIVPVLRPQQQPPNNNNKIENEKPVEKSSPEKTGKDLQNEKI